MYGTGADFGVNGQRQGMNWGGSSGATGAPRGPGLTTRGCTGQPQETGRGGMGHE